MEMGKLTAKLRDAVPVCLLVESKEIKRYKNIDIPDDLKKLEYQDFKFDVPLSGAITFKIMFEPGVLPEEFPRERERKMRKPLTQETQLQEAAPAAEVMAEEFAQALEDAQAAGERVADIVAAIADGEDIKAGIIEVEGEGRLLIITAEPEATAKASAEATTEASVEASVEAEAQPEDCESANKPARKGKGKKGAATSEDDSK